MPFYSTLFCSHRQLGFGQLGIIIHSAVYGAQGLCYFTDNLQGSV